ncbi:Phosphoenolpyruvate-protein phosphotransferase [Mycoplasma putrefaciens]|nr:Phosphoenolpyruvate-protein phosphotransferase [Mycoplasma putrefaciens]
MCGEMAGDIQALPLLIGMGLDAFSMSARAVLKSRSLMSKIDTKSAEILATQALECETEQQVLELVNNYLNSLK